MRSALALVLLSGCGAPVSFVAIVNGGVGPSEAACAPGALQLGEDGPALVAPGSACEGAALATEPSATFAYWRVEGVDGITGPVVSNPAELDIPAALTVGAARGLRSGASERGLAAGASGRGLRSGADERGPESGAGGRGLRSGASERGPDSGASERGLRSGASERGPESGAGERGLTSGAGERRLDGAAAERALEGGAGSSVRVVLRKRALDDSLREGETMFFELTFENTLAAPIAELWIVDHLPAELDVVDAGGARVDRLSDGTVRLVHWDHAPLPPGASRTLRLEVRLR